MSRFVVTNYNEHVVLYKDLPNNGKQVLSADSDIINDINSAININECLVKFDKSKDIIILQNVMDGSSLVFLNANSTLERPEFKSFQNIIVELCERNGSVDLGAFKETNGLVARTSGNNQKLVKRVSTLVLFAGIVISFITVHGRNDVNMVSAVDVTLPQAASYAVEDYIGNDDVNKEEINEVVIVDPPPVERPYIPPQEEPIIEDMEPLKEQEESKEQSLYERITPQVVETVNDNLGNELETEFVKEEESNDDVSDSLNKNDLLVEDVSPEDDWMITQNDDILVNNSNDDISWMEESVPSSLSIEPVNNTYESVVTESSVDKRGNETTVYLEFPDYSETDKAVYCKNNYYGLIEQYSRMYGLDPNLVLGIATQERGVHATTIDPGGALGLMQIQYNVLINHTFTVYELNEQTGTYDQTYLTITDDLLRDVAGNIRAGCAVLQSNLVENNYNLPAAIQSYNMGPVAVHNLIEQYAVDNGMRFEDVINNPSDMGWINYRQYAIGDHEYLEHINSWVDNNSYTVTNVLNYEPVSICFTNYNEQMRGK